MRQGNICALPVERYFAFSGTNILMLHPNILRLHNPSHANVSPGINQILLAAIPAIQVPPGPNDRRGIVTRYAETLIMSYVGERNGGFAPA